MFNRYVRLLKCKSPLITIKFPITFLYFPHIYYGSSKKWFPPIARPSNSGGDWYRGLCGRTALRGTPGCAQRMACWCSLVRHGDFGAPGREFAKLVNITSISLWLIKLRLYTSPFGDLLAPNLAWHVSVNDNHHGEASWLNTETWQTRTCLSRKVVK